MQKQTLMYHLVGIIIHEQDSVQMLEPPVKRLACVPLVPSGLDMLLRCLGCMASATSTY